jgi:hypothetical protein
MKRTLRFAIAVAAVLGLAAAANAATVTVVADAATYNVGDTITLTVNTNSQGEILFQATAVVGYTGPVTSLTSTPSLPPPAAGWFTAPTDVISSPGFRLVFDALNFGGNDPGTAFGGTLTFSADAPGSATFTIGGNPANAIDFAFGTAAAGSSVTVSIVPEPTTAALLGLGLFGLAVAGRRR